MWFQRCPLRSPRRSQEKTPQPISGQTGQAAQARKNIDIVCAQQSDSSQNNLPVGLFGRVPQPGCNRRLCDGFELTEGEVTDIETLVPILDGVEPLMQLAASAYVGKSVIDPRKYFRNNVESALGHMDAVLASEVRSSYSPLPATPKVSQRCFHYRGSLPKDPIALH